MVPLLVTPPAHGVAELFIVEFISAQLEYWLLVLGV
jgi:hypothetical protein